MVPPVWVASVTAPPDARCSGIASTVPPLALSAVTSLSRSGPMPTRSSTSCADVTATGCWVAMAAAPLATPMADQTAAPPGPV